MPSVSKAQQEAMAIAEREPEKLHAENKGLLKMSHKQLHDFASTKRKGLPEKKGRQSHYRSAYLARKAEKNG